MSALLPAGTKQPRGAHANSNYGNVGLAGSAVPNHANVGLSGSAAAAGGGGEVAAAALPELSAMAKEYLKPPVEKPFFCG